MLGMLYQKSKNETWSVILVFEIEVDTNVFMVSLPAEKIEKALATTTTILLKLSRILKETQFFTDYFSFYAVVIQLK